MKRYVQSATAVGHPPLRVDLNLMTLLELPAWSAAPRGQPAEVAPLLREAGYDGVQTNEIGDWLTLGLQVTSSGVVRVPEEARPLIALQQALGSNGTTIHLGTGMESADAAARLCEAILEAQLAVDHPVFIETHRGTLTGDMWRTLQLIERFPELRFNADLSHWYTGLSMTYGDFAAKLEALAPLFERTGYVHGRIGNQCSVQVPIGIGDRDEPHLSDFRAMWTACFAGALSSLAPGGAIVFAPELLANVLHTPKGPIYMDYAQLEPNAEGEFVERSDRWDQALQLVAIARECYAAAERLSTPEMH